MHEIRAVAAVKLNFISPHPPALQLGNTKLSGKDMGYRLTAMTCRAGQPFSDSALP
jgi:hypothetical protein